jgi:prolyl-tRNA synthetase
MLEVYRSFAEDVLAMPVIAGEKPAHERFPGADHTYSIEAMMQDGKALQAGTAHDLGTNFSRAQNIRYQTERGDLAFAHTTSWGVSTRLVGGVVMTHGDDDGLRLPPALAPRQVVLIPILRERPEDAGVIEYCEALAAELRTAVAFGEPLRVAVDLKPARAVEKRWAWMKRGVPLLCEIGPRDVSAGAVTFMRRDRPRAGARIDSASLKRGEFIAAVPGLLTEIQNALHEAARTFLTSNITSEITSFAELEAYYREAGEESFRGWARVAWARPQGSALEKVEQQLKALKLTIRNAPLEQQAVEGRRCVFSGAPAEEQVLVGRAY